jgi:hypothetical protein
LVGVLNRPNAVLEELVVNASMSLEAAGNIIGPVPQEANISRARKPTTAVLNYRSISSLGLDLSGISESPDGLARAIANNYNTIKHYDRGEFPEPLETYTVSLLVVMIARLVAVNLVDPTGGLSQRFWSRIAAPELKEFCRQRDVFIDSAGHFTKYPE